MASRSKQKGSSFERHICRVLSEWVSYGERTDLFWRSAMSGGRATLGLTQNAQSGDISPVDRLGADLTDRFSIELKHYKDLKLNSLFYQNKGGIVDFWQQCKRDADKSGKLPLLIAKQDFKPELICTTIGIFPDSTKIAQVQSLSESMAVIPLSLFLEIDPKDILR